MVTPRLRILYCEDDLDSREMMRLIMTSEGFDVSCAESSHECLRLARDEKFDAYVLDNWMPELSGNQLCELIRKFDSHTPVIFYSGAARQSDQDEAIASGAQAYVVKPASIEDLIHTIELTIEVSKRSDLRKE